MSRITEPAETVYSSTARKFHWLTVALIVLQFPIGLYMTYRGKELEYVAADGTIKTGLFDATTGFLYDSHKVIGLIILAVVVLRLLYRLTHGAPPAERSLPASLIGVSHLTHWLIYVLLIAMPVVGYAATSYYGATGAFGLPIPSLFAKDQAMSKELFEIHEWIGMTLLALIAVHVAAAFYHKFVRKDGVVARMLPKRTDL